MRPGIVAIGAQFGDEGKGKIVDFITERAEVDCVVRYAGGNNAGHTLVVNGEKLVTHLMPSGVLFPKVINILGAGMVIDPVALMKEVGEIKGRGLLARDEFFISDQAHVVMPYHLGLDEQRERGPLKIGTTKRGIGPTYEYKARRYGIRMCDLLDEESLASILDKVAAELELTTSRKLMELYLVIGDRLRPHIKNTGLMVHEMMKEGKQVLFEGAQGTLLDIDHGTYPFVTSSSAIAGGACTGVGIGPNAIETVVGITKAYTTRVGEGPFPTEMSPEESNTWRTAGDEFGASTGRPRRCGWLDLPMLRLSARLSGVSTWAITKMDIMAGMGDVPVCTHYRNKKTGELVSEFPTTQLQSFEPIYKTMKGWDKNIAEVRKQEDFSPAARAYIEMIESETGVHAGLVSVGSDRGATVIL